MGKYERKKAKKSRKGLVVAIILVIAAILLALFVMPQVLYRLNNDDDAAETTGVSTTESQNTDSQEETTRPESEQQTTETVAVEESATPELGQQVTDTSSQTTSGSALKYPYRLEDGKLEIESLFQFDGINPDCGNQEGKNIATITITNTSDTYLDSAVLTFITDSGDRLNFKVTDLPAGETALVFSIENAGISKNIACTEVDCEAVFNAEASMNEDKISVSVEGTQITLRNNTDTEIENIVVYCHASLGDQCFGGITYTYTTNNLTANATTEIDAVDCFLGLTEVVRIAIDET